MALSSKSGVEKVSKGKLKKQARVEAMRKEKERVARLREAASKGDLLDEFGAFRRYDRCGLDVTLVSAHGRSLSEADVEACISLQRRANANTVDDWDEAAARESLAHDESRLLLLRGTADAEASSPGDEWILVNSSELAESHASSPPANDGEAPLAKLPDVPAELPLLGYLHLQFCIGDDAVAKVGRPLLCLLNMQLAPHAMGKGLGKFALQLVELIARQNGMELVMFFIQDGKVKTIRLTRSKAASQATKQQGTPSGACDALLELAKAYDDGHSPGGSAPTTKAIQAVAEAATATAEDEDEPFELICSKSVLACESPPLARMVAVES